MYYNTKFPSLMHVKVQRKTLMACLGHHFMIEPCRNHVRSMLNITTLYEICIEIMNFLFLIFY